MAFRPGFSEEPRKANALLTVGKRSDNGAFPQWFGGKSLFRKKTGSNVVPFRMTAGGSFLQAQHDRARWLERASTSEAASVYCGSRRYFPRFSVSIVGPPQVKLLQKSATTGRALQMQGLEAELGA